MDSTTQAAYQIWPDLRQLCAGLKNHIFEIRMFQESDWYIKCLFPLKFDLSVLIIWGVGVFRIKMRDDNMQTDIMNKSSLYSRVNIFSNYSGVVHNFCLQ